MKARNLIFFLVVFLSFSCGKQKYSVENEHSYSRIFIPLAINGLYEKSMPIKDIWETIDLGVGYGGITEVSSDLEIKLGVDEEAVNLYNQQNNTNYELAPEGSYRLKSNTVSILSGKTGSNMTQLEVNPSLFLGTRAYLIPISILDNSENLAITEGLGVAYFLVSGFYEENPFQPIAKNGWNVIDVSSENADRIGGLGRFCIDDDINTCWLSQYSRFADGTRPTHPHYIVIDMNDNIQIHGLTIAGRITQQGEASQDYLFPTDVFIETSEDNINWDATGSFSLSTAPALSPEATLFFEKALTCRYFKITILRSNGNGDTTGISEVTAF